MNIVEGIGTIQKDGTVIEEDGSVYELPIRRFDKEFPEVLIDAKKVGGDGWMYRQSIEPFVGMRCSFVKYLRPDGGYTGDNFEVIPNDK